MTQLEALTELRAESVAPACRPHAERKKPQPRASLEFMEPRRPDLGDEETKRRRRRPTDAERIREVESAALSIPFEAGSRVHRIKSRLLEQLAWLTEAPAGITPSMLEGTRLRVARVRHCLLQGIVSARGLRAPLLTNTRLRHSVLIVYDMHWE